MLAPAQELEKEPVQGPDPEQDRESAQEQAQALAQGQEKA